MMGSKSMQRVALFSQIAQLIEAKIHKYQGYRQNQLNFHFKVTFTLRSAINILTSPGPSFFPYGQAISVSLRP